MPYENAVRKNIWKHFSFMNILIQNTFTGDRFCIFKQKHILGSSVKIIKEML